MVKYTYAYVLAIPLVDEAREKGAIMAAYYVPTTKNRTVTAVSPEQCEWKKSVSEKLTQHRTGNMPIPNRSAMYYTPSVLIPVGRSKRKPQLVGYWNYNTNKNKSYSYAPVILPVPDEGEGCLNAQEQDVTEHILSLLTEKKPEFVPCLTKDKGGAFVTEFRRRKKVPQFVPDTKFGKPALLYVIYQQPKKGEPFVCGLTVYDEDGRLIVHIMNFLPSRQSLVRDDNSLERQILSALGFTENEEHFWRDIISEKYDVWGDFGEWYTMPWPFYRDNGSWQASPRNTQSSAQWLVEKPHLSLTKLKR